MKEFGEGVAFTGKKDAAFDVFEIQGMRCSNENLIAIALGKRDFLKDEIFFDFEELFHGIENCSCGFL